LSIAAAPRLTAWLNRPHVREQAPVRLSQRRIYILPTRGGVLLGVTLGLMLLGCMNYNLGLGYVLTFLLAAIAVVTLLHTFRNLARLEVGPGRIEPVFAGSEARFPVLLANPTVQARFAVCVSIPDTTGIAAPGAVADWCDVPPQAMASATLLFPAPERGRLYLPRVRIHTTFPLGLFHAWSNVYLDASCVVYPRPESGTVAPPPPTPGPGAGRESAAGLDDFAGLRGYQPGDSPRHVAWKAMARGQELLTKQFTMPGAGELWLRWSDLPGGMRAEARLSRLTRWVLDAAAVNVRFGLEIPGARIAPDAGRQHETECLTALALFRVVR
jgi:uncharacterized protein (DUF58 family)